MPIKKLLSASVFALAIVACSEAVTDSEAAAPAAPATEAASEAPAKPTPDLSAAQSGDYDMDTGHGYVTFSYDHQGYSRPYLRFRRLSGELDLNVEDPAASSVSVTIDAASIDSGVDAFDEHLNSPDFFETATHPEITFDSTSLEVTGANTGTMVGDLTIKDITKEVTLNITFNKAGLDQRSKKHKVGFSAKGSIMRSDWDLGLYVPYVGDKVDLIIETEFLSEATAE